MKHSCMGTGRQSALVTTAIPCSCVMTGANIRACKHLSFQAAQAAMHLKTKRQLMGRIHFVSNAPINAGYLRTGKCRRNATLLQCMARAWLQSAQTAAKWSFPLFLEATLSRLFACRIWEMG